MTIRLVLCRVLAVVGITLLIGIPWGTWVESFASRAQSMSLDEFRAMYLNSMGVPGVLIATLLYLTAIVTIYELVWRGLAFVWPRPKPGVAPRRAACG